MMKEAAKFYDLWSAKCRPKKVSGINQGKSEGLRTRGEVRGAPLCPTLPLHGWDSPGQNTGVGSLSLLHGVFPTYGSNPDFPHCRQILYQLSHNRSPRTRGVML